MNFFNLKETLAFEIEKVYTIKYWLIFGNQIPLVFMLIFTLIIGIFIKQKPKHVKFLNQLSAYYLSVYLLLVSLDFEYSFDNLNLSFNQNTSLFVNVFILIATITTIIFFLGISNVYFSEENSKMEFTLLIWFIYLSAVFLISNTDFITTIILLECISFSGYILVGFERKNKFSATSALQYLILASIPGGIFILGITLLYNNFGTFSQDYLNLLLQLSVENIFESQPSNNFNDLWKHVEEHYLNDPIFKTEAQQLINFLVKENQDLYALFRQARYLERVVYFLNPTIIYKWMLLEDILIKDIRYFSQDFQRIAFQDFRAAYLESLLIIDIIEKEIILLEQFTWAHYYSMNSTISRAAGHLTHVLLHNMLFNTLTWMWIFEGDSIWTEFNDVFYQVEDHLYVFKFQLNSIIKNSLPKIIPQPELHLHLNKNCLKHLGKLTSSWDDIYYQYHCRQIFFEFEPELFKRFDPKTTGFEFTKLLEDIKNSYHSKEPLVEKTFESKYNFKNSFEEEFYYKDSFLIIFLSIIFILINLCFKLTAAPFHFWAPTIYGGSPLATVTFLSIFSKLTIIFFTIWLFLNIFDSLYFIWQPLFFFISVLSIICSIFGAFSEKVFKRFFVYSSMGHVGFMLSGIAILSIEGAKSSIDYLVVYILSSFIIWFIVMYLTKKTRTLINLKGLYFNNPWLSSIFSITIFSLSGIPPMAGFFVKFEIFNSIINSSFFFFAYILLFLTVISFFYYLRLIKIIYFENKKNFIKEKNLSDIKLRLISLGFFILILFGFFAQKSLGFLLEDILRNSLR